jgi:hypothetical protein
MNTPISWKTSKVFFLIILGLIFISHLPFIDADPDRNMSVGRGPFTDEGLNTIQVRNWVNHGDLSLSECDNLLKTPALGFPLALTYTIFGTSHEVSRLHVLFLVFLALLFIGIDKKNNRMMIIFLLVTMLQYQVFQSSHFSMAEMLSIASVLISVYFFCRSGDEIGNSKLGIKQMFFSGAFLSLSYYFKIQFIYLVLLFPVVLILLWFKAGPDQRKMIISNGKVISFTLIFFLLLYFFAWYLPNKEAYGYMMAHQSGGFELSGKTWEYITFNLGYHFIKGWVQWFVYLFLGFMVSGFIILKRSKQGCYPVMFISSLVWFLLELHKLTMVYLPTRYQVSLFVSMGLMISIVAAELWSISEGKNRLIIRIPVTVGLSVIFIINIFNYFDTLQHRSYAIRDANEYLARNLTKNDIVIGAWSPSLTWDSKARAIPVWNNFLNYKDPINTFKPKAIISETDEQDSEHAYKSQGINLMEVSDSSRTVTIGQWTVSIYWVKAAGTGD